VVRPRSARLHGELHTAAAPGLLVEAASAVCATTFLILDLRDVSFCDLVGLRAVDALLADGSRDEQASCCLLSLQVERVGTLALRAQGPLPAGDADLWERIAGALVADLEPPLAEWEADRRRRLRQARAASAIGVLGLAAQARGRVASLSADALSARTASQALASRGRAAIAEARGAWTARCSRSGRALPL
jgi:hypothetical protein